MRPNSYGAISYVRVSPGSPEASVQKGRIERAAARLSLDVVDHYEDNELDMPGMSFTIGGIAHVLDLAPGVGTVLVWDQERLRVPGWPADEDPVDLLQRARVRIIEVGGAEVSAPPRPQARERPRPTEARPTTSPLVQRLVRGRLESAKRGNHISGPVPYGYRRSRVDRTLIEPDPKEADVVRLIFRLYLKHSMRRVIEELRARGLQTRKGKAWSRAGLSWIIQSPVYVGRIHYRDVKTLGRHQALISPIIFNKANVLRRARDRGKRRGADSEDPPLPS